MSSAESGVVFVPFVNMGVGLLVQMSCTLAHGLNNLLSMLVGQMPRSRVSVIMVCKFAKTLSFVVLDRLFMLLSGGVLLPRSVWIILTLSHAVMLLILSPYSTSLLLIFLHIRFQAHDPNHAS